MFEQLDIKASKRHHDVMQNTASSEYSSRIDLFTTVHKGLRWQMGRVLSALGAAQVSGPSSSLALDELEQFLVMIDEHTHHEDEMIAPLLKQHFSDLNLSWQAEHRELEAFETTLRKQIQEVRLSGSSNSGLSLYRAFARFASAMLDHLDKEETTLMPLLWQACSEEELGGVMKNFLQRYGAEAARFHAQVAGAYSQTERAKLGL